MIVLNYVLQYSDNPVDFVTKEIEPVLHEDKKASDLKYMVSKILQCMPILS